MAQKIVGSSARVLNDVNLAKKPEGVGDSLSVHLSQAPDSAAVWTLQVWVHIQQGTYFLGQITTTAPAGGANVPSRTVLIATCPAATGWKVIAICPTDGEEAEIALDSSKCCSSAIGVRKLDAGGDADQDVNIVASIVLHTIIDSLPSVTIGGPSNLITPWTNIFSTGLANSFVVKAAAGTLRNVTVRLDSTLASGTYYLQLWNLAALPADATVVGAGNSLDAPVKVVHTNGTDDLIVYDFAELGIPFTAGAVLGLSSTEFTKTAVAGSFCSVVGAEYR
jgi:hypothetical protein